MQDMESTTSVHHGMEPPRQGHWYAIRTRSNFEKRIAGELGEKGLEPYLPAYEETRQWKDRKQKIAVPLFAGYLFARFLASPEERLRVLKTAGVVRILGHDGRIEPIPEEQIEAVRTVLNSRVVCFAQPLLREGVRVRVVRGALEGLEGAMVRRKKQARLVISIPLLNQSVVAEVNTHDVEVIGGATATRVCRS
jgi:transcription antitermination factor NusG